MGVELEIIVGDANGSAGLNPGPIVRSSSSHGFEGLTAVGPRQQLLDVAVRVTIDDLVEDVGEIGERIDLVDLAGLCRPPNYAESGRFPQISR